MSKSNSSSVESKGTTTPSTPLSSTSGKSLSSPQSPQLAAALESLLKKHAGQLADPQVQQYHREEFIDRIDSIVQQWMVKFIFELKQFEESELTTEVEQKMIDTISADMNHHFKVPDSSEEIDQILGVYRNFHLNRSHKLPEYFPQGVYLPNGVMPENVTIQRIFLQLRPKLTEAMQQLWRLNTAIHLLAPTVDFAHNTGVMVQRRIKSYICTVWESISDFLLGHGWLTYAKARLSRLDALFELPQSEDGRLAFVNFECGYFRRIRTSMQDLVFNLIMLNHVIMQHLAFLKKPRAEHATNLAARIVN